MTPPRHILPLIVLAQFGCTSLWFAGNGVMEELQLYFGLGPSAVGHLTSAVQLGFIAGTLVFALLSIADRFSPSKVFFVCALLGAGFNLSLVAECNTYASMISFRFLTGFCLAGIYPVGMKIAADYFQKGLGTSLGYLVGALVVGTALPHLLADWKGAWPWQAVLIGTSTLAVLGGSLILLFVPDGPFRKGSLQIDLSTIPTLFQQTRFRAPALGYFGHMWELYAFWAFVPVLLRLYLDQHPAATFNISLQSFGIIAIGGLACVLGGCASARWGARRIAFSALLLSGLCCLLLPLVFQLAPPSVFIAFLYLWGMVVIADSPLFSTLVAQSAPSELKGTGLTIVNSIGFAITIASIQLLTYLSTLFDHPAVWMVLAVGPMMGLFGMKRRI